MTEHPDTPSPRAPVLQARFTDIDALSEAIREWDLDWRQLDAGPLKADLFQVQLGKAFFSRVEFSRSFLQRGGSPPGMVTFGLLGESVDELDWYEFQPGDNDILCFPDSDYESVSRPGFRAFTLSFPEEHLSRLAELSEIEGLSGSILAQGEVLVCEPETLQTIRSRLRRILVSLSNDPMSHFSAALQHELEIAIPSLLLLGLSRGAGIRRCAVETRRSRALRHITDYIEDRRCEPIRVTELCEVGQISLRTLEYAFKERFAVSPKQFLKTVRLDGLPRDLRQAEGKACVADVANHWGFWHIGQLALDYRKHFSERPSETLGRSSGRSSSSPAL